MALIELTDRYINTDYIVEVGKIPEEGKGEEEETVVFMSESSPSHSESFRGEDAQRILDWAEDSAEYPGSEATAGGKQVTL